MDPQLALGLGSTAVAALAVIAGFATTLLSVRSQRINTHDTLVAQEKLARSQEVALRERSNRQELQERRTSVYVSIIRWADELLTGLSGMSAESPQLPRSFWHLESDDELLVDMYASDRVHVRYAALRAKLYGLVADSGFTNSPIVTWQEVGDVIDDVQIDYLGTELIEWPAREKARDEAEEEVIGLIAAIRAEVQHREATGYFILWRLER